MTKTVVLIGGNGVGKSMLRRALMALQLRDAVVTVADINDSVDNRKHVNVGTIGHVDCGKSTLSKAIAKAVRGDDVSRRNKSDRKRNRADRWR